MSTKKPKFLRIVSQKVFDEIIRCERCITFFKQIMHSMFDGLLFFSMRTIPFYEPNYIDVIVHRNRSYKKIDSKTKKNILIKQSFIVLCFIFIQKSRFYQVIFMRSKIKFGSLNGVALVSLLHIEKTPQKTQKIYPSKRGARV